MKDYTTPRTTTRIIRHLPARETIFADIGPSAGDLLAQLPDGVERVYLVGGRPDAGWLPWALDALPDGWEPGQHYLEGAHPVLRYRTGRRSVAFHCAAAWFPSGRYSVPQAADAYRTLAAAVRGAFPVGELLDTAATTGRELMLQSIAPGTEWPVLSAEHQELIRSTSGQARIETLPDYRYIPGLPNGLGTDRETFYMPALYEYDMRLAYAASAWGLGAGTPTLDAGWAYEGQTRGRYRIDGEVPPDWPHPFGLVGVKDGRDGWYYPHEPGEPYSTWCDGAELHVLNRHGWGHHCQIRERLLFPDYDGAGPLDTWRNRLVTLYENLAGMPLTRQGVRSIILHSIGALHASTHEVTRFARSIDDVPNAARARVRFEGDYCLWPETHGARWEALAHPEWSAAIWARTRARLLDGPGATGALHAVGSVVAFSTDALYLTERQPWNDDGEVGRFRLKRWGDGPYPWPANRTGVIRLANTLTEVGDE